MICYILYIYPHYKLEIIIKKNATTPFFKEKKCGIRISGGSVCYSTGYPTGSYAQTRKLRVKMYRGREDPEAATTRLL